MAVLVPLKGTTKSTYLFEGVIATLNRLGLYLINLSGVTTDDAPAMVRRQEGLVKLMQEATTAGNNFVVQHHCLIYQQYLCAKSLKSESVIRVVNEVNFIRSEGLNHREFQDLLHNLETEFEDVVYYSEVRWLSRGKMLKRVFHLKQEIRTLMEGKGKPVAEFNADEWMCDFAFKVDITTYLNELNTRLQGKDQFMNCLITSSPSKCNYVFGNQLEMESLVHFPILLRCNGRDSQIQAGTTSKLREEFDTRFQDFKNTDLVSMLWSPFSVSTDEVPGDLEMECVDFQCASDLKHVTGLPFSGRLGVQPGRLTITTCVAKRSSPSTHYTKGRKPSGSRNQ
jgi:hypothetical protein